MNLRFKVWIWDPELTEPVVKTRTGFEAGNRKL